jgi:hypothetical protein
LAAQPRARTAHMSQSPAPENAAVQDIAARVAAPGAPVAAPAPAGPGSIGAFASGMGNASFARSLGGGGNVVARMPAAGAAAPPADGVTAALARSVQQRRVARDGAPGGTGAGASTTDGPSSAIPDDPAGIALRMGDQAISDHLAPDKPYSKEWTTKFAAGSPQMLSLQTHLFPGVFVHFNAGVSVAAGARANVNLALTRAQDAGTTYVDSVKGSGSVAANGLLVGSLSAGLGVGIPGANVKAHASGSLRLSGSGSATVGGTMRRTGGAGSWSGWAGRMNIDGDLKGSLTAAASGYFSWQVLWFDGRFGEFRISEWKLGDASIKLKGWADLQGGSDIKLIPDFSPPQQPKVESRIERRAPQQGQPATGRRLGTKRREGATGGPVFIGAAPAGTAFDAMVARETAPPAAAPPAAAPPAAQPAAGPQADAAAPPPPGGTGDTPPDGRPPSDPDKLPSTPAEAGLPDVEGGGGVAAVPAGPTEPGGA